MRLITKPSHLSPIQPSHPSRRYKPGLYWILLNLETLRGIYSPTRQGRYHTFGQIALQSAKVHRVSTAKADLAGTPNTLQALPLWLMLRFTRLGGRGCSAAAARCPACSSSAGAARPASAAAASCARAGSQSDTGPAPCATQTLAI